MVFVNVVLKKFGLASPWIAIAINLIFTLSLYAILIPFMKKYMPHVTAQKDIIKV